jgi:CRP/FNR family transcriptional regulator, cyclic AMP receptor protein
MAAETRVPGRRIRLLDVDPELGSGLAPDEFEVARRYALADVGELERGTYEPWTLGDPELLGLLVLAGLGIRSVQVAGRRCGELVAPGSILRPWDHFGQFAPLPFEVSWRVIEPVRLALLDQRLVKVGSRWPAIMQGIVRRAIERSHALALGVAIHSLQHIELRLLVLFWHLADRFGRVTPDGIVVPLRLSHRDISELIGAQRPSTSVRLAALARRGELLRREDRTWMLHGEPPAELRDLRTRHAAGAFGDAPAGEG